MEASRTSPHLSRPCSQQGSAESHKLAGDPPVVKGRALTVKSDIALSDLASRDKGKEKDNPSEGASDSPGLRNTRSAVISKSAIHHTVSRALGSMGEQRARGTPEGVSFNLHPGAFMLEKDSMGKFKTAVEGPVCGGDFLTTLLPTIFESVVNECLMCAEGIQTPKAWQAVFERMRSSLQRYIPYEEITTARGGKRTVSKPATDTHRILEEIKAGLTNKIDALETVFSRDYLGNTTHEILEVPGSLFALWLPCLAEAIVKKVKSFTGENEKAAIECLVRCSEQAKRLPSLVKGNPHGLLNCVALYRKYMKLIDKLSAFCPVNETDIAEYALTVKQQKAAQLEGIEERATSEARIVSVRIPGMLSKALQVFQQECENLEAALKILTSHSHIRSGNPCGQLLVEIANLLIECGDAGRSQHEDFQKLVRKTEKLPATEDSAAKKKPLPHSVVDAGILSHQAGVYGLIKEYKFLLETFRDKLQSLKEQVRADVPTILVTETR